MTDFLHRLKQRKLVQWAVAYAAAAFALLQGMDMVGQKFGWPDSIGRILIIASCIGFFVTLVLAWYHGERGAQKVSGTELLILSLVLVVGGGFLWQFAPGTPAPDAGLSEVPKPVVSEQVANVADRKSIAVLPFENLSDDKANEYFASGMQDLILTKLADIGDLKVISRTSTREYGSKPENLKLIATQLGVATVLEGSVQKVGDQVLINVQLIDARNDHHLWAQTYQRTLDNIFGVEGEVAGKIADALKARLSPLEVETVASVPTRDPAAFDAYLRGERFYADTSAGDFAALPKAVSAYQQAVDQDPRFALAWAKLAFSQSLLMYTSLDTSEATIRKALENARHALTLAPDLPQAHYALGYVYRVDFGELDKAMAQFEIARRGLPNDADIEAGIAYINIAQGKPRLASEGLQRAVSLNPRDPNLALSQGWVNLGLGRYDRALEAFRRVLAIAPDDPEGYGSLSALALRQHADVAAALAGLDRAPAALQTDPSIVASRVELLLLDRDYDRARKVIADLRPGGRFVTPIAVAKLRAEFARQTGDQQAASDNYRRILALAAADDSVAASSEKAHYVLIDSAIANAGLGHRAEAFSALDKATALTTKQGMRSAARRLLLARAEVQVVLGDDTAAISTLERALAVEEDDLFPFWALELEPVWDPLRKDPRFQRLLDDAQATQREVR